MYRSTLFLTSALDVVGGQSHAPNILPPGKKQHPLHRSVGGPQGQYGWVRKISPPPGFNTQNAQPCCYTSPHDTWNPLLNPSLKRVGQNTKWLQSTPQLLHLLHFHRHIPIQKWSHVKCNFHNSTQKANEQTPCITSKEPNYVSRTNCRFIYSKNSQL
jgi:hypothetical protein